jgi:hypothetical protein
MTPGRREWDIQVLRTCFFHHDIQEICKIRISGRMEEDKIAWQYEKASMFSVRREYKLALQQEDKGQWAVGSSSNADGNRPLYKGIWSALVPPKVCIFTWRLSQEGLATQCNRRARKLEQRATCQVCGGEEENGHHAVVTCTKARALRQELRAAWPLPDEEQFLQSGQDWLILLLSRVDKETGARILLLFWRAWYLRNDVIHGKGTGLVGASARFLIAYYESLQGTKGKRHGKQDDRGKGKMVEAVIKSKCRRN